MRESAGIPNKKVKVKVLLIQYPLKIRDNDTLICIQNQTLNVGVSLLISPPHVYMGIIFHRQLILWNNAGLHKKPTPDYQIASRVLDNQCY